MIDLSDSMGIDEVYDITSSDAVIDQSETIYNGSTIVGVDPFENDFNVSSETMRLLFITIATISVLACLSICLSVFICVCLNRYVQYTSSESEFDYLTRLFWHRIRVFKAIVWGQLKTSSACHKS